MRLPDSFKDSMRSLLGGEYEEFISSYEKPYVSSIRVNTSKISCEEFEKIAPFAIEKTNFCSNGYYINDTDAWSKHPYYYAGLYYIQEASAMLPAAVLPIDPGETVLDLCAAPGGKSTQLVLSDAAVVIANDISYSRTIPLVKNLEMFGTRNYAVTCESPGKLSKYFEGFFDKILVDAPCSGEGMFRKDSALISSYEKKGSSYYCDIQKEILDHAVKMLGSGGMLLYSTCTFSDIEDEQVILDLLSKHPELSLEPINISDDLSGPYDKYKDIKSIQNVVHAFPHRFRGEGHFLALIKKTGEAKERSIPVNSPGYFDIIAAADDLLASLSPSCRKRTEGAQMIKTSDDLVFCFPEGFDKLYIKDIRYVRTGTFMGKLNKSNRLIPSAAFARTLKSDDHLNVLSLDPDDPLVIKYLKGETITPDSAGISKGYVLVCVDGFPLGFAKYDGSKLKNLLDKGWVYR